MSADHDPHLDEDRLAAWILDGGDPPGEVDQAHLDRCAVCTKRLAALRGLVDVLDDLRADDSLEDMPAPWQQLSGRSIRLKASRGRTLWVVAGLAAAAVIAAVVPRTPGPTETIPWSDPSSWPRVTERTIALFADLPEETADSLLAHPLSGTPAVLAADRLTFRVAYLEEDQRWALYRILRDELSRVEPEDSPDEGGGT